MHTPCSNASPKTPTARSNAMFELTHSASGQSVERRVARGVAFIAAIQAIWLAVAQQVVGDAADARGAGDAVRVGTTEVGAERN